MCKIHPDVPYIVREGISVHGGYIGWGCAVCNMLELEKARATLRKCRNALTAGSSEEAAARNAHYWEPVIKTIDAALCSPSRDKNLSIGSALSDATTLNRKGEA
jgi:hypothetical protein